MVESIESRFLRSRDFFALRYKEGLVFLEVEEYEDTKYKAFSNLEDIASGSSLVSGYQRLKDSDDDDIIYVPSDDELTVLHLGIGIAPSVIEMFVGYPSANRQRGELPDLSTSPIPGNNLGMVDGTDSPYRQPSVKSELVIPPKQQIDFDFQNPGDDSHEPLLNVVYRKYKVFPLDIRENRNDVARIINPGSPAPIFPVGNFTFKSEFNLGSEWGVTPVDRREAIRQIQSAQGGGR